INMEDAVKNYKTKGINLSKILYKPNVHENTPLKNNTKQDHDLENVLDFTILKEAKLAIEKKVKMNLYYEIKNTDRTVGTIVSNEISKLYGAKGLPKDTLEINFKGAAGQSFGAFGAPGLTLTVSGNTNDYFGKGLSGSKIIVKIPKEASFKSEENVITGNVALYGATAGEAYINGIAGERFCVRNSGAIAVVEGVGDHGCEYMTGGTAIILGDIGRNFAAGMSGGVAYIYKSTKFDKRNFNSEMIEFENPSNQDLDLVKKLIENHFTFTSSKIAERFLNNWDKESKNFIKIMPTEYKLALEKMAKEKITEIIK
ncbi:glutamate synthase subunit alpha, partial [Flavobacteriaceae bacterium]|nr:glutamate synthase subunit alpha [Flavobacteriaceae bacterium]